MATKQKKGKRPDLRPARTNYWQRRTLRKRKARALFKSGRFASIEAAALHWDSVRQGRIRTPKVVVPKVKIK